MFEESESKWLKMAWYGYWRCYCLLILMTECAEDLRIMGVFLVCLKRVDREDSKE